jgi:hypothetical protein
LVAYDTIAERIAFYHAVMFSPAISTWCDAIDNGHFTTWPELTSAQVRKHLSKGSVPMIKGHLHQQRSNLRSTKQSRVTTDSPIDTTDSPIDTTVCFAPLPLSPPQERTHEVAVDIQPITGKIYTDQTGRFMAPSSAGNEYVFILYEYDGNSIHAEAIKNRTAPELKRAYAKIVTLLKSRGLTPKMQILDNEASKLLQEYIKSQGVEFQLAPPHVHRRNAAERAISTYKDHLIAGLSSTDKEYPLHLWDKLIAQSVITLNLLRRSRINPQLSAYAQVFGAFDFNKTPMAPPGTRVLVHEKPSIRGSWDPRAIEAWYIGPAMKHYRCYCVWIWATKSERIADTLVWFPTRVKMPTISSNDLVLAAANDLVTALQNPNDSPQATGRYLSRLFIRFTTNNNYSTGTPCISSEGGN